MYGVSLFVLREVFEIVLIVSVMMAATRGVAGRMPWLIGGLAAGTAGAAAIAMLASTISNLAEGRGQEILNAVILLSAAAMIGWTAIWMRVHGRELATKMKTAAREKSLMVLSVIVALAMFREGAEMVLFSFSAYAQGTSWAEIFSGAAIGIVGGLIIGGLFYLGMIKLFARHFLSFTSILLTFLAAGLAAKGVYYLAMVGMVPELKSKLWDSSAVIANDSILGESLGVLLGYNATPSGIELLTYLATLVLIYAGLKYSERSAQSAQLASAKPA